MKRNHFRYLILVFLFLSYCIHGFSEDPDPRDIMDKVREAGKLKGLEAVSTLRIIDAKGRERIRQTSMASREFDGGDTEKRIIRFLSPAEVEGTGMLIYDYKDRNDDMWIYMPALRKTRRIVSSEKSKSFMGSEFSNADMSAPNPDDFEYRMIRTETLDGCECWVIESIPLDENIMDEMGFDRKISWICKTDFVQRQAEYYNEDDEVFKRLMAYDVRNIDPAGRKSMAMKMEMYNLESGRKSIMTMDKIQYNPAVKEEYFTQAYLEKL